MKLFLLSPSLLLPPFTVGPGVDSCYSDSETLEFFLPETKQSLLLTKLLESKVRHKVCMAVFV